MGVFHVFKLYKWDQIAQCTKYGEACNFTKINTPQWVFFTFFKLYKWYQISQRITYFQNFSELTKENEKFVLELKKSLLIIRDKLSLNRNTRSAPLYLFDRL